jgi:hypothetical protein
MFSAPASRVPAINVVDPISDGRRRIECSVGAVSPGIENPCQWFVFSLHCEPLLDVCVLCTCAISRIATAGHTWCCPLAAMERSW